jgi:hypothetical protein
LRGAFLLVGRHSSSTLSRYSQLAESPAFRLGCFTNTPVCPGLVCRLLLTAVDQEASALLCANFVQSRWSDYADSANQVCSAAATGELSDCTADADASLDEKAVYWSACEFGKSLATFDQGSADPQACENTCPSDSLELYSACINECKGALNNYTCDVLSDDFIPCRAEVCSSNNSESCWRGCNIASAYLLVTGSQAGTEQCAEDYALECPEPNDGGDPYLRANNTGNVKVITDHTSLAIARKVCDLDRAAGAVRDHHKVRCKIHRPADEDSDHHRERK